MIASAAASKTQHAAAGTTQASGKAPASKQAPKATTKNTQKKTPKSKPSNTTTPDTAQAAQSNTTQAAVPAPADPACPKASVTTVAGNADVMLNQTNIGENNNKFYRLQLLEGSSGDHWLWSRWGRVGDHGQTKLQGPFDAVVGYKEFKKKFRCCAPLTAMTFLTQGCGHQQTREGNGLRT